MYTQYFGLSEPLFGIAQNPEKLYLGAENRIAYRQLVNDLKAAKKAVVLCGPAGSGKTTIVRKAVKDLPFSTQLIEIQSNEFKLNELIRYIENKFAIAVNPTASLIQRVANLKQALRKKQVEHAVILIEQAHRIESDLINGVQLFTQSDTDRSADIQFVFVGTPESAPRLKQIALRNFESHELGICDIKPLNREEVPDYIRYYLDQAGCNDRSLFNDTAIERVKQFSGGVPRLINLLCNGGMLAAYLEDKDSVDAAMIDEASTHCLYPDIENQQSEPGHKRIELQSKSGHSVEKVSIVQGWPFDNGIIESSRPNDGLNAVAAQSTSVDSRGESQDLALPGQISSRSLELPKRFDESKNLTSDPGSTAVPKNIWDRLSSNGGQACANASLATAESVDRETAVVTTDYADSDDIATEKDGNGSWSLFPEMISKAATHNQSLNRTERSHSKNSAFPTKHTVSIECPDQDKPVQMGGAASVDQIETISSELNDGCEVKMPADVDRIRITDDSVKKRLVEVDAPFRSKGEFSSESIENPESRITPVEPAENIGLINNDSQTPGLMSLSEMIGKASKQSGRVTDESAQRVISNAEINKQESSNGNCHDDDIATESTEMIQDLIQRKGDIEQKRKVTSKIVDSPDSADIVSATSESGSGLQKTNSELPREPSLDIPSLIAIDPSPSSSYGSTAVALIVLAIGLFLTFASLKAPIEIVEVVDESVQRPVVTGDLNMDKDLLAPSLLPFSSVSDEININDPSNRTKSGDSIATEDIDLPKADINTERSSRQARIEKLVKLAEAQISKKQLMTPENDNALATYHEIMQLAPEQRIGQVGVTRIKEIYMQWARAEVSDGNIPHAKFLYGKALTVAPGDVEVLAALNQINTRKVVKHTPVSAKQSLEYSGFISDNERIAELLERANRQMYLRQLVKPVGRNAYDSYSEVLRMDSGNREALEGLQWIKTTFVNWANSAMENRDWGRAEVFFLRALKVAPNDQQLISKFDEFKYRRSHN